MDEDVKKALRDLASIAEVQNNLSSDFKDDIAAAHVLLIGIIRAFAGTPGFKESLERTISEIEVGSMPEGAKKAISDITRRSLYRHD